MPRYFTLPTLYLCLLVILTSSQHTLAVSHASETPFTVKCDSNLFDGLMKLERDFQTSTTTLSAHWTPIEEAIQYEWAAVSSLPFPDLCSNSYRILPDVISWQKISTFYAQQSNLNLQIDHTYYNLLRITLSTGQQLFIRSNGIKIVSQLPLDSRDSTAATATLPFSAQIGDLYLDETTAEAMRQSLIENKRNTKRSNTQLYYPLGAVCPYDQINRCRQISDRNAITEQLDAIYGDNLYSTDSMAATIYRKAHTERSLAFEILTNRPNPIPPSQVDMFKTLFGVNIRQTVLNYGDVLPDFFGDPNIDITDYKINARQVNEVRDLYKLKYDDDGEGRQKSKDLYEWIIAPGLAGVALVLFGLAVIVLIVVIVIVAVIVGAILLLRGLGGREGTPGHYTGGGGDDDDDPSAFNRRGQAAAGSTDDKTNIEFPDTEIRRLSITHDDNAPAASSDGPKRKHPIMESSSSSFRDFRSANV